MTATTASDRFPTASRKRSNPTATTATTAFSIEAVEVVAVEVASEAVNATTASAPDQQLALSLDTPSDPSAAFIAYRDAAGANYDPSDAPLPF